MRKRTGDKLGMSPPLVHPSRPRYPCPRFHQGALMPGLLTGKKGLVLNIANDRSIAWHIANNAIKHGATCGFGYLPMEKMERRVRKSLEEMAVSDPWLAPCDVGKDDSIDAFFKAAGEKFGTIDF